MRVFLFISCILQYCFLSAQEKENVSKLSFQPFLQFPYYSLHSNGDLFNNNKKYPNNFNYGCGILVSKKINKIKINIGLSYNTKNYYRDLDTSKVLDKIKYLNIPIVVIFSNKACSPFIGFIFNKPYYFNNKAALRSAFARPSHAPPYYLYEPEIYFLTGYTLRLGCEFPLKKLKSQTLNMRFYLDYKFNEDVILESSYPIVKGHIVFGLEIGLEF